MGLIENTSNFTIALPREVGKQRGLVIVGTLHKPLRINYQVKLTICRLGKAVNLTFS